MRDSLTSKQEQFCIEYILCNSNATEAARKAGYSDESENSLAAQGSILLRNINVLARISQLREESGIASGITIEWVLAGLVDNVSRAMQLQQVYKNGIPIGEYKYDGSVANKAFELIAKMKGWMDAKEPEKPQIQKTPEQLYQENLKLIEDLRERSKVKTPNTEHE